MSDDLISRQAAINVLEERLQANGYSNVALVSELNRSIGYLMRLPSAQPNTCEYWDDESDFCALNRPSAQPTIDAVEVVHGEWIKENIVLTSDPPQYQWHCSECRRISRGFASEVLTNYCLNCGAKMDGKEQGNDYN